MFRSPSNVPRPPTRTMAVAFLPLGLLALPLLLACEPEVEPEAQPTVSLEEGAHPRLRAHSAEFEKRIHRVGERVYVAVGFGLANSIMIEGDDGVIIVDSMASMESAREVAAAFREISPKPIVALVYTHNHADHVFGSRGFVPDGNVPVYAHETTVGLIDRVVGVIRPIIARRSGRMFGNLLPSDGPDALVNAGIGPFLELRPDSGTPSLIRPNRTFRDRLEIEIAGVPLVLVHAPGETDDQLFVWLPEERVLLPGDNIYKAFPNLYTIRGTPYRDVMGWVHSLDAMRALRPEHLVPSHTRPVSGEARVMELLTVYRDGIQYVHDQTIRGINQGLTPDELVQVVHLPPHLAEHPYLEEFYGTVEWSVRAIYSGYLGWFDGDAAHLSPAPPRERAEGYAALAGGFDGLLAHTRQAVEAERYAWAAELSAHLLRLQPQHEEARRLQARALRALGRMSKSPNGRNYYLSQALELEGAIALEGPTIDDSVRPLIASIPIGNFIATMPSHLDADKAGDTELRVGFRFPDVGEAYTLELRRGVLEFHSGFPVQPDIGIEADSQAWRDVVTGFRNPALAFVSGDISVEGSTVELIRFLGLFSSDD